MEKRRQMVARGRSFALVATALVLALTPSVSAYADEGADETSAEVPEPSAEELAIAPLPDDHPSIDVDNAPPIVTPNRHWQPHWERFSATGALIIGVAEAAAFSVFIAEPVTEALWIDRLPGDDWARRELRIEDPNARADALASSDAILGMMMMWPFLVDSVLLAGVVHQDEDAALQMFLIDGEVMAVAHMILWLTTRLTGRVRPEALECTLADNCTWTGVGPVSSFVGGHALMAYASAGLSCVHHAENQWLTGSQGGAVANCVTALSLATAMTFMRIGGDRHWLSDSAIGAAIGAMLGFGMPYLLHYGRARTHRTDERGQTIVSDLRVTPGGGDGPFGMTVAGTF